MIVTIVLPTVVPIADPITASVDLESTLMTHLRRSQGMCVGGRLIKEVTRIVAHGSIESAYERRREMQQWQCAVLYEATAVVVGRGECILATKTDNELTPSFENSCCVVIMSNDDFALRYKTGDVVPLVAEMSNSVGGQPKFTVLARPWTVSEMRLPLVAAGPVEEGETDGIEDLLRRLEEVEAELGKNTKAVALARERLGLERPAGPAPAGKRQTLSQLVARLQKGEAWPQTVMTPEPGTRELVLREDAAPEYAAERPAVAVRHLVAREITIAEMLVELASAHEARLKKGAQDHVWTVARKTRAAAA